MKAKREILQIIPVSSDWQTKHEGEDDGEHYEVYIPCICLALVKEGDNTEVMPMEAEADTGLIDFADRCSDFSGLWQYGK